LNKTSREIAYLSLLDSLKNSRFISDTLDEWQQQEQPSTADFNLAQEIAYGSARMAKTLDYLATQLSSNKKLNLKLKEKALLRTALYQHFFLDRIPIYALASETLKIAQKYCHPVFGSFVNGILRKLPCEIPLPAGDSVEALEIRYSYPPFFIQELIKAYGLPSTKEILAIGNKSGLTMARLRTSQPFQMMVINESTQIDQIAKSPDYYIQNITPMTLMSVLKEHLSFIPGTILDLCASPGGKSILAHDFFPKADLYANDISEEKLKKLSENFKKYGIQAHLSCAKGEELITSDKFDLIILDVPCSNSGVLNRRPEARWRLSEQNLNELEHAQLRLLEKAVSLLAQDGQIWYLTCSILPQENERLIQKACHQFGLKSMTTKAILPNQEGYDGGFAASLKSRH
jgi:16S rRNA (cytosine967-C5)-methyltransferase